MEKLSRNDAHRSWASGATAGRRVKGNDGAGQRVCSSHRQERSTVERPRGSSSYESNRLAKALGISPSPEDGHLWWIVQEAVSSELPEGWSRVRTANRVRYQNDITGEITVHHPLELCYKGVAAAERARSDAAIEKYARDLGLDLESERDLMWIAHEAGTTPLPFNWRAETFCNEGRTCYRNTLTGRRQVDHPFYRHYRTIVLEERFRKQLEAKKKREAKLDLAWPSRLSRLPMDAGDTHAQTSNDCCTRGPSADRTHVNDEAANNLQQSPTTKSQSGRYSEDELSELAPVLGLHPTEDRDLLWLVSDFLDEPLPAAWEECVDDTGSLYFYNHATGEFKEDHPLYERYLEKVKEAKRSKRPGESHEGVSQGKSFDKELARYASDLNLDPSQDSDLMWIAKEAMKAQMPDGWCRRTINETGETYYFNYLTGENLWVHPNVQKYKKMAHEAKQDKKCDTLDYAMSLGVDEASEGSLLAIVAQLLSQRLPDNWESGVSECGYRFYFNVVTNECSWDHPLRKQHVLLLEQERRKQNRCPASGAVNRCDCGPPGSPPVSGAERASALAASDSAAAGLITWIQMEKLQRTSDGPAADGCVSESESTTRNEEQLHLSEKKASTSDGACRSDKTAITTSPSSAMLAEDADPAALIMTKDESCQWRSGSASTSCCSRTSESNPGSVAQLESTSRSPQEHSKEPTTDRSQSSVRLLALRQVHETTIGAHVDNGSSGFGQMPTETPWSPEERRLTACPEKNLLVLELGPRDHRSSRRGKSGEAEAGDRDAGDVIEATPSGPSVSNAESQQQERDDTNSGRTAVGGKDGNFKEHSHLSSNAEPSTASMLAPGRQERLGQAAQDVRVRKSAPSRGAHSGAASRTVKMCCRQWFKKRRHCKDCPNAKRT